MLLANDLEDFVLLKSLMRNIERKILRVDDTLNRVEVFGDGVLTVVHDEDATNVEFDVVTLLFGLEEIERHTNKEHKYIRLRTENRQNTAWEHRE